MATTGLTTGASTIPAATAATTQVSAPALSAPASTPLDSVKRPGKDRSNRSFKARNPFPDSNMSTKTAVSHMCSSVADYPPSAVPRNSVTYIVPCFTYFFYILSIMDLQMVHTKRYTDTNPDWIPLVSRLYFSILLYYQTLRCQAQGGQISYEQTEFLEFLERAFPNILHAKIPGPLVNFFQGLASNAGLNENFGNHVFGIPNNLGVTQATHFMFANRLNHHLPSLIAILDQFMAWIHVVAPINANVPAVTASMVDSFYTHIFGNAAANPNPESENFLNPGMMFEVAMTQQMITAFQGAVGTWHATLPFDPTQANTHSTYTLGAGAAQLGFDQVLGFRGFGATVNNRYNWFNQCARIMQPYTDYFRDSVSLGAINTDGIGIIYVKTIIENTFDNAQKYTTLPVTRQVRSTNVATDRYECEDFADSNTVSFEWPNEYLDATVWQNGYTTQLNVVYTQVNGNPNTDAPGPLRGNSAVGPIDGLPAYNRRTAINVAATAPVEITGYYHVPVALKFE